MTNVTIPANTEISAQLTVPYVNIDSTYYLYIRENSGDGNINGNIIWRQSSINTDNPNTITNNISNYTGNLEYTTQKHTTQAGSYNSAFTSKNIMVFISYHPFHPSFSPPHYMGLVGMVGMVGMVGLAFI